MHTGPMFACDALPQHTNPYKGWKPADLRNAECVVKDRLERLQEDWKAWIDAVNDNEVCHDDELETAFDIMGSAYRLQLSQIKDAREQAGR